MLDSLRVNWLTVFVMSDLALLIDAHVLAVRFASVVVIQDRIMKIVSEIRSETAGVLQKEFPDELCL